MINIENFNEVLDFILDNASDCHLIDFLKINQSELNELWEEETKTDLQEKILKRWNDMEESELIKFINKIEGTHIERVDISEFNEYFIHVLENTPNSKIAEFLGLTEEDIKSYIQDENISEIMKIFESKWNQATDEELLELIGELEL